MRPAPSARHRRRVTTIGGSAHFAPVGFPVTGTLQDGSAGIRLEYAIHLPSGDQAMLAGASCRSVILASWPVSIQRTWTCVLPLRLERYARREPSGDHRGELSRKAP